MKAVQGSSVNLSCELGRMTATQRGAINVSWVMLKAAKTLPVTSERARIDGASLSFRSVGEKDTSWYRCVYKQEQAQHCYDINLQVQGQSQGLSHCEVQMFLFQVPGNNQSCNYSDCASDVPTGTEINFTEENKENAEVEAQHSSSAVAAAVTVVLLAVVMAVALAGFFLHRRRNRQMAEPPVQRDLIGLKA